MALGPLSALARARRADLSAERAASGASFVSSLESPAGRGRCWESPGESRSPPPPGPNPDCSRPLRAQFSRLPPLSVPTQPKRGVSPPSSQSPSPPPLRPLLRASPSRFPSSVGFPPPRPLLPCAAALGPLLPKIGAPPHLPLLQDSSSPGPSLGDVPSRTLQRPVAAPFSPHPLGAERLLPGIPGSSGARSLGPFLCGSERCSPGAGQRVPGQLGCRRRTRSAFPPGRASRGGAALAATWRSSGYKVSRTWPLRGADTGTDLAPPRNAPSPEADPDPRL